MSNFIYNSYCVVHPGAEQVSLTTEYRQVAEAAPAERGQHLSFLLIAVAAMAVLAAFASAGEGALQVAGMALWVLAVAGLVLSFAAVRRSLKLVGQALRAWQHSRQQAAADEHIWNAALQDARLMADLARAMDRQER